MTRLVVLHDFGDTDAHDGWTAAFRAAGWPGSVVVADLPGDGRAPAPQGGDYELPNAAIHAAQPHADVLVGVGLNGWAAQILGLAGRTSALALVDGLSGSWVEPGETIERGRPWLRAIADDPGAVAPAPQPPTPDPRMLHGVLPHGSRDLAFRAAAAMPVPVVLIETPSSPIPASDARELADAAGWQLVHVESDRGAIAAAITAVYGTSTTRPKALRSSM